MQAYFGKVGSLSGKNITFSHIIKKKIVLYLVCAVQCAGLRTAKANICGNLTPWWSC